MDSADVWNVFLLGVLVGWCAGLAAAYLTLKSVVRKLERGERDNA